MKTSEASPDASGKPEIVVVAAVIEDDGRYLLAQRAAGRDLAGMWEFPGGKIEPGESTSGALRREIREELDIEIAVADETPVKIVHWKYPLFTVKLIALRARIVSGEPRPLDHSALRWVRADEMTALELLPADRPIAARLLLSAGVVPVSRPRGERSRPQ